MKAYQNNKPSENIKSVWTHYRLHMFQCTLGLSQPIHHRPRCTLLLDMGSDNVCMMAYLLNLKKLRCAVFWSGTHKCQRCRLSGKPGWSHLCLSNFYHLHKNGKYLVQIICLVRCCLFLCSFCTEYGHLRRFLIFAYLNKVTLRNIEHMKFYNFKT